METIKNLVQDILEAKFGAKSAAFPPDGLTWDSHPVLSFEYEEAVCIADALHDKGWVKVDDDFREGN